MTLTERVLFAGLVNEGTGIPKLVVHAWVLAEGGPRSNPLNIGPGRDYGTVNGAATATIELLRTSRYAPILRAARTGNDQAVLRAIGWSPWNGPNPGESIEAAHKRYTTLLRGTYARAKGDGGGGGIDLTPGFDLPGPGDVGEAIERAAGSVETFLVDRSKLALAYVGLTAASVVLFIIGLQLATGVGSVGLSAMRSARASAGGGQGEGIPF